MTTASSLTFLSLVILTLHFTSIHTQNAKNPVALKHFDADQLLNHTWYGIVYGDTDRTTAFACSIYEFTHTCSGTCPIVWLTAWNDPLPGAAKYSYVEVLKPMKGAPQGAWYFPGASINVYFVDRADNYDWVIFLSIGQDGYDYVELDVISKTPQNQVAKARAQAIAKQYGMIAHEVIQDSKKCDYKGLRDQYLMAF